MGANMNNRKQQQKQRWARPSLLLLVCLFLVILIIPSLIVVPYSQPKQFTKELQTNIPMKEEQPATTQVMDSPIEISVYRTKLDTVESIPLEEYVVGVVASEMPSSFELEALKAQALAARTYIIRQMLSDTDVTEKEDADITDNYVTHQVYKNNSELAQQWGEKYKTNLTKIQNAVNATKGQIITYKDEPIDPTFFSTSNGYTENSEDYWENSYPYLKSVESPWDKESPKFNGQKILTMEEVERALGIQLDKNTEIIGEKKLTKSKRVDTIEIGNKEFSGVFIREQLGLASNDFDIQQKGENIIFTTRGNGHGVGMSQYGANGMAKESKNYKDIVKHYYQGVEINSLDPFTELVMK